MGGSQTKCQRWVSRHRAHRRSVPNAGSSTSKLQRVSGSTHKLQILFQKGHFMRVCCAVARAASCTSVAVYTSCEGFKRQYSLSVNRKSISGRKLYYSETRERNHGSACRFGHCSLHNKRGNCPYSPPCVVCKV